MGLFKYRKLWWRKANLYEPKGDAHRQASWMELFFDLIMIVAFTQIENFISYEVSASRLYVGFLATASVWFVWNSLTVYSGRFENMTVRHRVIAFIFMVLALIIAISFTDTNEILYERLGVGVFFITRLYSAYVWSSASRGTGNVYAIRIAKYYSAGVIISGLLALSNVWIEDMNIRLGIWGLAIFLENAVLFLPALQRNFGKLPPAHPHHLPERVGLLVILVLGEIVLSTLLATAEASSLVGLLLPSLSILIFAFMLWWIYFDHIIFLPRKLKTTWMPLHLFLIFSLLVMNVGIHSLFPGNHGRVNTVILPVALGFVLFFIGLLELHINYTDEHNFFAGGRWYLMPLFKLCMLPFCWILPFVLPLGVIDTLLLCFGILLFQVMTGTLRWYYRNKALVLAGKLDMTTLD